ncbi:linear amide C-N hydrolase, partial [Bacteroides acidifaciens]
YPGSAPAKHLGNIELSAFGSGSGFLGIPGDITPPSRFVRAAFYQTTAPQQDTALKTVLQCFQILNNFDIPVGIEFPAGKIPANIPSATQWTSATDIANRIIYFRTMYNSAIRSIDLHSINFSTVRYQAIPMDIVRQQPVENIRIK